MNRTKAILIACFCAAFVAGCLVGLALTRFTAPRGPGSWLAHRLNLSKEQQEQMRKIWSEAMGSLRDQHKALREERDAAIQNLLTEEQKAQYEEVMRTYAEKSGALEEKRKKAFEEAKQRTLQILTPAQRKKYEEVFKERPLYPGRWHGPSGRPEHEMRSTGTLSPRMGPPSSPPH